MANITRNTRKKQRENNLNVWLSVLRRSGQATVQIDRRQIVVLQAIRSTIGFALPLIIGVASGHVVEGVSMAGGAATVGTVGLAYTYRARARAMLLACTVIAISAFVGSVVGHVDWLAILVTGLWGLGAGLLVAINQEAMVIGLQAVTALILLSHFSLTIYQAALQALLMFAGALIQTVLGLLPTPWYPAGVERNAVGNLYEQLANYAAHLDEEPGQQLQTALLNAGSILSEVNAQSRRGQSLKNLFDKAEHIRLSLIVISEMRQRFVEKHLPFLPLFDRFMQYIVTTLRAIASDIEIGQTPEIPFMHVAKDVGKPLQDLKSLLAELQRQVVSDDQESAQQIQMYCTALRDQVYSAKKSARSWRYGYEPLKVWMRALLRPELHLRDAKTTLRANLTLRSDAFRHALRLGITLAIASTIYRVLPLPVERGYWIPLTVLLVLRPDFTSTFNRGPARFIGTLLGAILTTLLIALLPLSPNVIVLLTIAAAYLAFSLLLANYAIFSIFITIEVVLLLALVSPQPAITALYRAIDTTIGGVLALLAYLLWPTWESSQLPVKAADRLAALRAYLLAVLDACKDPATFQPSRLQKLRLESRLNRSNAEASLAAARKEPHRADTKIIEGVLQSADDISYTCLVLEGSMLNMPTRAPLPELTPFIDAVNRSLKAIELAIRGGQLVEPLPDLSTPLSQLEQCTKDGRRSVALLTEQERMPALVLAEAKHIQRAIDAMKQLVNVSQPSIRRRSQL